MKRSNKVVIFSSDLMYKIPGTRDVNTIYTGNGIHIAQTSIEEFRTNCFKPNATTLSEERVKRLDRLIKSLEKS